MSRRSARRGRSPRAILAAGLLALAVAPLASHALGQTVSPVLVDSSVRSGWSRFTTRVSAKYNRALDLSQSTATVTDDLNVAVAGTLALENSNTLVWTPGAALSDRKAYTITFVAMSDATAVPVGDTAGSITTPQAFKVDLKRPDNPTILQPAFGEMVSGAASVTGNARDKVGDAPDFDPFATSGISAIELHFYELRAPGFPRTPPIVPPSTTNPDPNTTLGPITGYLSPGNLGSVVEGWVGGMSREVLAYRTKATICSANCLASGPWSVAMPDLSKGVWAVKAIAIDLAGNVSGESAGVTFIRS